MADLPEVEIYTDGACSGNPGPGGYGVVLRYGNHIKEISGGYAQTTNNRMELMAVIEGLRALKRPCRVTIYTDSRYIVDAMTRGWVRRWQANGWRRENGEPAKNADLWRQILSLASKHRITWVWVKGHADNIYNNRCDQLAVEASRRASLPVDPGFQA
ncbi:ribonuclease HI [Desulfofundulus sp. TPOSR]|uniref:ribonuclease HI n=1 Tax=Desulfofundulus sp. TPOSR TaxID=2714340 RepID=UPI00140CF2A3|nr:ribonuclease HI [Desulfofundulus sp. TPOSR]NHM28375.1 ribonuclease HI [Desulfofundulus sp. TPOSR]